MILGVPKEVKDHESRVGVTPAGVKALVEAGHTVLVETKAGDLSSLPDDEYQSAGAEIVARCPTYCISNNARNRNADCGGAGYIRYCQPTFTSRTR